MRDMSHEHGAIHSEKEEPESDIRICRCDYVQSTNSRPQNSQVMMTDGVLNRAIDEFDWRRFWTSGRWGSSSSIPSRTRATSPAAPAVRTPAFSQRILRSRIRPEAVPWSSPIWSHSSRGARHRKKGIHDVAKLCGGAGDTAELLITRGYSGGPNFDILCGFNLLNPHTKYYFLRYLQQCRPNILLISTPCTGMKGFSALIRAINYAGWMRSRRVSVPLGDLAGLAAQ